MSTRTARGMNRCDECRRFKPWSDLNYHSREYIEDTFGHVREDIWFVCNDCESPTDSTEDDA